MTDKDDQKSESANDEGEFTTTKSPLEQNLEIVKSIAAMAARFQEQYRNPLLEMMQKASEQFKPILEIQKQLQGFLHPVLKFQRLHGEKLMQIGKIAVAALQEMDRFHGALVEIHAKEKLFLSPFFMNSKTLPEIRELFSNREKSAIQVYQEFFGSEVSADEILQQWEADAYLGRRIRILRAAMNAHLRKEFELSIPVFLSQIEGLLREILSVEKHSLFEQKLKKLFPPEAGDTAYSVRELTGADLVIDVICGEIFESTGTLARKPEKPKYPNRHGILHGVDIQYFEDEFASTRCILVLDLLRMEEFTTGLQSLPDSL